MGKRAFLLLINTGLFLVSIIQFSWDIIRAFVFLINKPEPGSCFYGAGKRRCSETGWGVWPGKQSVNDALGGSGLRGSSVAGEARLRVTQGAATRLGGWQDPYSPQQCLYLI